MYGVQPNERYRPSSTTRWWRKSRRATCGASLEAICRALWPAPTSIFGELWPTRMFWRVAAQGWRFPYTAALWKSWTQEKQAPCSRMLCAWLHRKERAQIQAYSWCSPLPNSGRTTQAAWTTALYSPTAPKEPSTPRGVVAAKRSECRGCWCGHRGPRSKEMRPGKGLSSGPCRTLPSGAAQSSWQRSSRSKVRCYTKDSTMRVAHKRTQPARAAAPNLSGGVGLANP